MVRKGFIMVDFVYHNRIPTYHLGSSEDYIRCCNDFMQPKGCIGLCKYVIWSNEPSVWVVNCSIMVARLYLGTKVSILVQGRLLCALLRPQLCLSKS